MSRYNNLDKKPDKKAWRAPCKRCGKKFARTSRFNKICPKCHKVKGGNYNKKKNG